MLFLEMRPSPELLGKLFVEILKTTTLEVGTFSDLKFYFPYLFKSWIVCSSLGVFFEFCLQPDLARVTGAAKLLESIDKNLWTYPTLQVFTSNGWKKRRSHQRDQLEPRTLGRTIICKAYKRSHHILYSWYKVGPTIVISRVKYSLKV